jgi:hypothetical protein
MKREFDGTSSGTQQTDGTRVTRARHSESEEWIRSIPGELLEPHPLVRELRHALEAKDSTLAAKEREIARLEVALAFGIERLPFDRSPPDAPQ